jgi:hypothetical protein
VSFEQVSGIVDRDGFTTVILSYQGNCKSSTHLTALLLGSNPYLTALSFLIIYLGKYYLLFSPSSWLLGLSSLAGFFKLKESLTPYTRMLCASLRKENATREMARLGRFISLFMGTFYRMAKAISFLEMPVCQQTASVKLRR